MNDVPVSKMRTWTLTFEVGPSGLAVDDGLLVYIPHGWSPPLTLDQGFKTTTAAGFCTAVASRKETTIRLFSSLKDQTRLGEGGNLWVAVEGAPLTEGDTDRDYLWGPQIRESRRRQRLLLGAVRVQYARLPADELGGSSTTWSGRWIPAADSLVTSG